MIKPPALLYIQRVWTCERSRKLVESGKVREDDDSSVRNYLKLCVINSSHTPLQTCCGVPGQWELFKEQNKVPHCFGSTGQKQTEKAREKETDEKKSLSSHPHYVNEVHGCSVGPSRVNYQWLLSLIG